MKTETTNYVDLLILKEDEMAKEVQSLIALAKAKTFDNDWIFKEPTSKSLFGKDKQISDKDIAKLISAKKKDSWKSYKRMCKAFYRANKKQTRRSINYFFHKLGLKSKLTIGKKEQEIQKKREAWKAVQATAEKLLAEYKEEKGDFYKNRLVRKAA